MMTFSATARIIATAATAAVLTLSALAPAQAQSQEFWEELALIAIQDLLDDDDDAQPERPVEPQITTRHYCFDGHMNAMTGDFNVGFHSRPVNRSGNTLYYTRLGGSSDYRSNTGAVYTIYPNGTHASWSANGRVVQLHRC